MSELHIDTTGWLQGCGHPGCRWLLDPSYPECPEHRDQPLRVAETDAEIAEAKARAALTPEAKDD
jgi:hypothetical protein